MQRNVGNERTVRGRLIKSGWARAAGALMVMAAGLVGVLQLASSSAFAYQRYYVTMDSVALRSGPGTQFGVLQRVNHDTPIDITCQQQGGTNINGNATWDKLTGGQWISDYYTTTPSWNNYAPGLGSCTAPPPAQPPSGSSGGSVTGHPPATARNIGYNPFAAKYSNQCTYYAEQRMANQTGKYMPVYGNAYQFADQARAGGWTVGTTPAVNSVVVFPIGAFGSSVGHVAWVVGFSGNSLHIQDYNWNYSGAHMTDHWVTTPSGTQFIYSDR